MDVSIRSMESLRIAYVRHTGSYDDPTGLQEAWGKIMGWSAQKKILKRRADEGPLTIGISLDDPITTPPERCRYDACVVVDPHVQAEGDVRVRETRPGLYAVCVHRGSYSNLGTTYRRILEEWFPTSGYTLVEGGCLEIYLNSPWEVPEEELLTEICVPVRKT
jgi:AraC family transcriptional regulator